MRTAALPDLRSVDSAVHARLLDGDRRALEEVYDRLGGPCYGLARRVLRDEGLAQEVVQEVFLALWRDPSRYDPARGGLSTFLLSLTHHKAVDVVRREENQRRRRAPAEALAITEDGGPDLDEMAWQGVRRDIVRQALDALPAAQREALMLAYFGGYTQREIAGITGAPLGTVKTRMLAGVRALRRELGGLL